MQKVIDKLVKAQTYMKWNLEKKEI
jgi:hypothetical protein